VTDRAAQILVVDDDPAILDALRLLLEGEGYAVRITDKADCAESLCTTTGELPDLIVLDILLSGKDGRVICQTLKQRDDTRHIPIVMVSAYPDAGGSAREVGADAFLAKPFSVDELLDAISALLP
jgi:CheY-like chemotaxis protein